MEFKSHDHVFHYWWVEPNKFLAGQTPVGYSRNDSRQYLKYLLEKNIYTFISLQEEDEVIRKSFPFYHDQLEIMATEMGITVSFMRFPIADGSITNINTMILILDSIDSSIRRNRPVYVHCMAGNGRTGTVVGCWLARHGTTGFNAIKKLRTLRESDAYFCQKPAPQKPGQTEQVLNWHEGQ